MRATGRAGGRPWRPDDELLTVAEMCAALGGVSRRTFYRWRELGVGPKCLKIPNGELRAWRSEFSAWLEDLREGAA
jgi:predicted DNA-binding transcriptional regulator AlpA